MTQTITQWPMNTPEALGSFYGRIYLGDNGLPTEQWEATFLTQIRSPFPLRLPWTKEALVTRITCHREVAPSLHRVLGNILRHFENGKAISEAEYDLFGGCYAYRPVAGSNKLSLHSYGAAIQLGPMRAPKRVETDDDIAVDKIFNDEGWAWLGMGEGWGAINI